MKSNNIMLRANRLNERITCVDGATVIISANMKKAGVVGRALVIFDGEVPLYVEIDFVYEKKGEYVNLNHDLAPCRDYQDAEGTGIAPDLYDRVVDKITDFCNDFQEVGNRADCPCDYWLVPGNTEIVDL